MPIVNIRLASPLPDKDKKDKLAKKITNLLVDELGKNKDRIIVMFEEIQKDDIFFGGTSVEELVKR